MNKRMKRQLLIGITAIISLIMIGIGGKVYMDKREERKVQELLTAEKQSVQAIKNTFADIGEVKFEKTGYNSVTVSYRKVVTMKNSKGQSVYFDFGFGNHSQEVDDYGIVDRHVQIEGITYTQVKVTYSNGQEEEG